MNNIFEKVLFGVLVAAVTLALLSLSYAIFKKSNTEQCTVTITDMQGVRHQIKGVADNE